MSGEESGYGYYDPNATLNSTDFEATITFTNPTDGNWVYGLKFRKDKEMGSSEGYGEQVLFSKTRRGLSHYAIENDEWVHRQTFDSYYGQKIKWNVREQNELRLVVINDIAEVFVNGVELRTNPKFTLKLTLPPPGQLKITPFSNGPDIVDFKDFSVKCRGKAGSEGWADSTS
jgi:hypothetical protein